MIRAAVTLSADMLMHMGEKEAESFVMSKLSDQISSQLVSTLPISKTEDHYNQTITYTAQTSNPSSLYTTSGSISASPVTSSSYNTIRNNESVLENLRVVEYYKGEKVTRVELQFFDGEDWKKVPRLRKEDV